MIFETLKTATDGREFTHHKIVTFNIDFSSFTITPIIRSWQSENEAISNSDNFVEFYAEILHTDYQESYLVDMESQVLPLNWMPYKNQYVAPPEEPVFDLASAKIEKQKELASARQRANLTSFTYNGKEYSATQTAQNDLNAIANYVSLFNALPASFPNAWQAIDGSVILIPNPDAFKPLYSAMVAQGANNFIYLQTLLSQVQLATTKEELDLVQW